MAKTGFWLRNAKGKLAGATIYQQNGETVMREIVKPSNPKTERQIIQRIVMHTVMQAYSKMKEICDHSFEGFKKGQDTMAYFMKRNVQICREAIAGYQAAGTSFMNMYNFLPLGQKGFAPNQYQVSMGSLPVIPCNFTDEEAMIVPVVTTNTYQYVINALGLKRGDQLTFIVLEGDLSNGNLAGVSFHYCRVILDPTDPTDFSQLPLSTPFVGENGKINAPSVRNEGNFTFAISASGLEFHSSSAIACGCSVIASRKVNDAWLRSTAYVRYNGVEISSLGEAIDLAEGNSETVYAPSEQYLNNAGQGGGQAAAGTSDDSSSPGGSTTVTPRAISASIGGNTMIAGTRYTFSGQSATSTAALVVNTENADGNFISVRNGSTEVASGAIGTNGTATISNGTWNSNVDYSIVIVDESDVVVAQTTFSFRYQQTQDPGTGD